jgi:GNAT superfamily N-acetyltransferase
VAATTVWLPPGVPVVDPRKLAATPALPRVLLADPRAFPTFMRYGANVERAQPGEPHWHLEVLSVRPEHQRHGLGSRLVRPITARADRNGVPCHLEAAHPANVAFHRWFGFKVLDAALEVIPGGGPAVITMRRPPG